MDYKKIILTGNLVADAEIKQSDKGPFTTFRVACNSTKEDTEYYSIAINGDKLAQYLLKGKKVLVEGLPVEEISKPNQYGVQEIYRSVKRASVILQ